MTTVVGTPPGVTASGYRATPPPIPLTGLVGWFDASHDPSFTYGTAPQISKWNDRSGAGNHATWVNSGNPATRVAAAINGLAAVDPHPAAMNTPIPANLFPISIIMIVKTGGVSGNLSLIGQSYPPSSVDRLNVDQNNGTVRLVRRGATMVIGQATSAYTANAPTVLGVTYGTDNVWAFYRNGTAIGTGTTAAPFTSGAFLSIGALDAPSSYAYDGLFGELAIYNRVITTTERQQIETYLKTKWGTP